MHAEGRLRNLPGWHIRHPIGRIKNGSDQLQAPCLQYKGHVAARKGIKRHDHGWRFVSKSLQASSVAALVPRRWEHVPTGHEFDTWHP